MSVQTIQTLDIDAVNRELEVAGPDEIIRWAVATFGEQCFITTSFQVSGMVLLHKIKEIAPRMEVLFIDTLHHFPETLAFKERIRKEWNLNLVELRRELPQNVFEKRYGGPRLFERDQDLCCLMHKVDPLRLALEDPRRRCWIVGLRRDQSAARARIRIVEDDGGIIKVHPLANWTRDTIDYYLEKYHVPHNPLFDDGYLSIGCHPDTCTSRPTANRPGMNERDGRWSGRSKLECGLHTFLKANPDDPQSETI